MNLNKNRIERDYLATEGLMYHDPCLTDSQKECAARFAMTIQIEQESYLTKHPEIKAMTELFICKMAQSTKRKNVIKDVAEFFTKPFEELDRDVRERLGVPEVGPYTKADVSQYEFDDLELLENLKKIHLKHNPPKTWTISSSHASTPNTLSSSFLSMVTSDSTLPTPEPIPTPVPTMSQTFMAIISNTVDKAFFLRVDDRMLRYDTAYVELMKCVENAMEIPVIEIREDIAELFYNAYKYFELNIIQKETIAAEIAWEKRMRKKLKRTLRRMDNFKGYVTPPTPKSQISSHESYKKPPPKPCVCHPPHHYNRYPKDRFGIYLPSTTEVTNINVTVTPVISVESLDEAKATDEKADTKSMKSRKSVTSTKSGVSKKITIKT